MPNNTGQPLSPLEDEALDGYREEASIHRDEPLQKTCNHKNITFVSSQEIKCGCGVGWQGPDILKLYNFFKSQ